MSPFTRRDFLAGGGALAATGALGALGALPAPARADRKSVV